MGASVGVFSTALVGEILSGLAGVFAPSPRPGALAFVPPLPPLVDVGIDKVLYDTARAAFRTLSAPPLFASFSATPALAARTTVAITPAAISTEMFTAVVPVTTNRTVADVVEPEAETSPCVIFNVGQFSNVYATAAGCQLSFTIECTQPGG